MTPPDPAVIGAIAAAMGLLATVAAVATYNLRVGWCRECRHCQEADQVRKAEQERLNREYARKWGLDDDSDRKD